jgi:hypothetical protein
VSTMTKECRTWHEWKLPLLWGTSIQIHCTYGKPEEKMSEVKAVESSSCDPLPKPKKARKRKKWKKATEESVVIMMRETLPDLEKVGIDTCSAVSVSTERGDLRLYLDETIDAKESVILNRVGGANSSIGRRGPMVVRAKDDRGNDLIMFDPAGVLLDCTATEDTQPRFRIFGDKKIKEAGLNLVQDKHGDGTDYLCYRQGQLEIPLETTKGILILRTEEMNLTAGQMEGLNNHIDSINEGNGKPQAFVQLGHCPSLIMNEAKLTPTGASATGTLENSSPEDKRRQAPRKLPGLRGKKEKNGQL